MANQCFLTAQIVLFVKKEKENNNQNKKQEKNKQMDKDWE